MRQGYQYFQPFLYICGMKKILIFLLLLGFVSCDPADVFDKEVKYRLEYAVHYPDTTVVQSVVMKTDGEAPKLVTSGSIMGTPKLNFYPMREPIFLPCEIISCERVGK